MHDAWFPDLAEDFAGQLVAVHAAASNQAGSANLYKDHELAGSNSLRSGRGDRGLTVESVKVIRA